MIQQLVLRWAATTAPAITVPQAAVEILDSDPLDLVLRMEQVWHAANVWNLPTGRLGLGPSGFPGPAGPARQALWLTGQFGAIPPAAIAPEWDHFGYSFALENTRLVQIMRRVVARFRNGESLSVPSVETQRWLDATEVVVFGAPNPFPAWLSTSAARPDPEAVRRNAYWRLMGMDLAFGTEHNTPFVFDKADARNQSFVPNLEELLYEVWKAIENIRNTSGVNAQDNDRIYLLAQQLGFLLGSRRQSAVLAREELAAATALGWLHLSVSANTPVVIDLRAQATHPADRLRLIGERVGLAPHTRADSFFSMASELSVLLRTLEAGYVSGPGLAWLLYDDQLRGRPLPPGARPIGADSRRVITEWSAASGRDLKIRKMAVQNDVRRPALTAR